MLLQRTEFMRFTWLTYFIAKRRAHRREFQGFSDYYGARRGPTEWLKAKEFNWNLKRREKRERTKRKQHRIFHKAGVL